MPVWLIVVVVLVGWIVLTFVGAMIVGKGFAAGHRWGRTGGTHVGDIPNAGHAHGQAMRGTTAEPPRLTSETDSP